MKYIRFILAFVLLAVILPSCVEEQDSAPEPVSDSPQRFESRYDDPRIPVDDGVYTISGEVVGEVESLVRQTSRATGFIAGTGFGSFGAYFGPEYEGKGFVRLKVSTSDSHLAPYNSVVILKVTDTKGIVLLPGDQVTFKCRHHYENVGAVRNEESFDAEKLATWEIDYCRLATPIISFSE